MAINYHYKTDIHKTMTKTDWDNQYKICMVMMGVGMSDMLDENDIDEFINRQRILEFYREGNYMQKIDDIESDLRNQLNRIVGFRTNITKESTRKFITRISKSTREFLIRKYCEKG